MNKLMKWEKSPILAKKIIGSMDVNIKGKLDASFDWEELNICCGWSV
jgi:hypothetical protein